MGKLAILILACVLFTTAFAASDCPLSSKVTTCTPKCVQDTDCSALGGRCCPNICNLKSCAQPNQLGQQSNSKYGSASKGNTATGSYCGNVKCSSFEKCDTDKSTNRPKCVRT